MCPSFYKLFMKHSCYLYFISSSYCNLKGTGFYPGFLFHPSIWIESNSIEQPWGGHFGLMLHFILKIQKIDYFLPSSFKHNQYIQVWLTNSPKKPENLSWNLPLFQWRSSPPDSNFLTPSIPILLTPSLFPWHAEVLLTSNLDYGSTLLTPWLTLPPCSIHSSTEVNKHIHDANLIRTS